MAAGRRRPVPDGTNQVAHLSDPVPLAILFQPLRDLHGGLRIPEEFRPHLNGAGPGKDELQGVGGASHAADPHNRNREMFAEMNHPTEGTIKQLGIPIKLSDTPGTIRTPPPALGQHTAEVLAELGYSPRHIARYRDEGIV